MTFSCRVSGQPCPLLEWEKDGHKLGDLFESSHFAVGQAPEDWHFLKLFGARPPDAGVYVCRARSGSREALAAAVLLVEPRATDGTPGGSPSNGPQLLAQPQPRRHRHAGSDTWAPVPNGVPGAKAFAVSAGKHAKFRCYVTGKPKPEIIWQKDGKALAPSRRHLIYEDREGYFILKVLYCKPQDQGLYVCTASNTAGQTLSAVQLRVKGRCAPREGFVGSGFAWQASVRAGAPGEHAAPWSPSQMGLWDHGCGTIPTPHLPCAQHCPAPRTVLGARSCSPNNSLPRCGGGILLFPQSVLCFSTGRLCFLRLRVLPIPNSSSPAAATQNSCREQGSAVCHPRGRAPDTGGMQGPCTHGCSHSASRTWAQPPGGGQAGGSGAWCPGSWSGGCSAPVSPGGRAPGAVPGAAGGCGGVGAGGRGAGVPRAAGDHPHRLVPGGPGAAAQPQVRDGGPRRGAAPDHPRRPHRRRRHLPLPDEGQGAQHRRGLRPR